MQLSSSSVAEGFSLIETTIAAALAALFLSSLFTMNVASMDTIRCAKESVSASQTLQQRVARNDLSFVLVNENAVG